MTTADTPALSMMDTTRRQILDQAEELFCHYGFAKTNMADIAKACDMSTANLYRYYRNKHAIGMTVVEVFFQSMEAGIRAALEDTTGPEARIRTVINTGCQQMVIKMATTPKLMELADFVKTEEEPFALLRAHIETKRHLVEAELSAGMDAGIFRRSPVYETAVNIMHATKAFQVPQSLFTWRDPGTIMPELDGVLDLIFSGINAR